MAGIQKLNKILPLNIILFIILTILSIGFANWYISQEKYYYFWDYSRHYEQLNNLIKISQRSPIEGVFLILVSLFDDYTQLPLLLMLPTRLLLGDSRVSFIISIVMAYGIPFSLMMGVVASNLVKVKPRLAFWIAATLALFTPATWVSMLRGFPDLGGTILIWFALLMYWQDVSLKQRSHRRQIAIVLALSVLFRRHFVYSVRSFLITILIFSIIYIILQQPLQNFWTEIKVLLTRLGHIVIIFSIFIFVIFLKAILINYRALYASYEVSTIENIDYYSKSFGYLFLLFSMLGFSLGNKSFYSDRMRINFIGIWGALSILQWVFFAKQISVQYTTHFVPFIVIGFSLFLWYIITALQQSTISTLFTAIFFSAVLGNMGIALSHLGNIDRHLEILFARREPPLQRSDYSVIASLVNVLRQWSLPDRQIYVAAASYTLNNSVLIVAEQQQLEQKKLKILKPANIDSRDFYPLNSLLKSHFVVVATPPQYHVKPNEQRLMKSVVDIFEQNQAIAQDFRLMPDQFILERGVKVKIYKRIQPTSLKTILKTLSIFKVQVPRPPASEPYWLTLESEQRTDIQKELLLNQVFISRLTVDYNSPNSLLYFGPIPASGKLTGRIKTSKCTHHKQPVVLTVSALNEFGEILSQQSTTYIDPQYQSFEFKLPQSVPALLQLDLRINRPSAKACQAELSFVQVSQK